MTWVAAGVGAAGVVAGVAGGISSSHAAKKAAKQQRKASQQAQVVQDQQHAASGQALAPYTALGGTAANALSQGIGDGQNGFLTKKFDATDFQTDPGYQFRMDQGTKAVQGSAAAQGGVLSGAAQKALAQYGQGFASNEYSNAYNRYNTDQTNQYNRITGATQIGQNATNALVGTNTDYANQVGNLVTGAGNAQAAGTIGSANALQSGFNSAANSATNSLYANALYNRNQPYSGGTSSSYAGGNIPTNVRSGSTSVNTDLF